MSILYASFASAHSAEHALGALLDQGARSEDLSILANSAYNDLRGREAHEESSQEDKAKGGISTTTGADAAVGAAKGLAVGTGLGIAGALAALLIPGVGLVIGAGALATALTAGAATAAAGAVAGGAIGYLKDQGISEDRVARYHSTISSGGALLSVNLPTGSLDESQAEGLLLKYGANDISSTNPQSKLHTSYSHVVDPIDLDQPRIASATAGGQVYADAPLSSANPLTGEIESIVSPSAVEPTRIDPITGQATEGWIVDSNGVRRQVKIANGQVTYVI